MADQSGNAHDMIHVGMGDEEGINRLYDPFGKMGDLAAVEEQRSPHGTDPQKEERIVQQPSEKSRFDIAKGYATFHMDLQIHSAYVPGLKPFLQQRTLCMV